MRRGRPSKDPNQDLTDQHIIMQLRKVVNLGGQKDVEFRNGDKVRVDPAGAQRIMSMYNNMSKPADKEEFQDYISYSFVQFSHYT